MMIYEVHPSMVEATKVKIEKINARAAKRGFTGRLAVDVNYVEVQENGPDGLPRTKVVAKVAITGEAPCYDGWTLLAAVDSLPDGAFVLRCAPGVDDADVDRSLLEAGRCEHCKTRRPNRVKTYLVRGEDGQYQQVGATCLKDFLGWQATPVFLSPEDVDRDIFISGGEPPAFTPETVIAVAWACTQTYGFAPSSFPNSTRSCAWAVLAEYSKRADQQRAEVAEYRQAGVQMAPQIIATVLEAFTDPTGYEGNVSAVLTAPYVDARHFGIAVSAVAAYNKIVGKKTEKPKTTSAHVGAKGEKIRVELTVVRNDTVDGYAYGTYSKFMIARDNSGNVFKLSSSSGWVWDVVAGDQVTVAATVKNHSEYAGVAQTELVRPKRVDA